MSVIEQAAKRLQELQRAGIETAPSAHEVNDRATGEFEARTRSLSRRQQAEVRSSEVLRDSAVQVPYSASSDSQSATESRRVELDLARIATAGIVTPDA